MICVLIVYLDNMYHGKEPVDYVKNNEQRRDEDQAYPVRLLKAPSRDRDLELEELFPRESRVHIVENGTVRVTGTPASHAVLLRVAITFRINFSLFPKSLESGVPDVSRVIEQNEIFSYCNENKSQT